MMCNKTQNGQTERLFYQIGVFLKISLNPTSEAVNGTEAK